MITEKARVDTRDCAAARGSQNLIRTGRKISKNFITLTA
jgi:hypothetical protein